MVGVNLRMRMVVHQDGWNGLETDGNDDDDEYMIMST